MDKKRSFAIDRGKDPPSISVYFVNGEKIGSVIEAGFKPAFLFGQLEGNNSWGIEMHMFQR